VHRKSSSPSSFLYVPLESVLLNCKFVTSYDMYYVVTAQLVEPHGT